MGLHTETERIVWTGTPSHWTVAGTYLKWFGILLVTLAASTAAIVWLRPDLPSDLSLPFWLILLGACAWPSGMILWVTVKTRSTVWELSTERLTLRTGIFSRRTDNLELYRVQDFFLFKPFPLWLLGYGYVKIITKDKTDPEMVVGLIKNPTALYELLRKYTEHYRHRSGVRQIELT